MDRRSFFKRASGIVVAVAAPLFIPSERLDFGVPTTRLIVPDDADEPLRIIRQTATLLEFNRPVPGPWSAPRAPQRWYVGSTPSGLADGSSWQNRFGSLADAERVGLMAGDDVMWGG